MRTILLAVAASLALSGPMISTAKAQDTTVIKKKNDDGDRTTVIKKRDEPATDKKVIIHKDY